jgi:hypothetical protein
VSLRHALATLALGPVLLAQGKRLRRTAPTLPEPAGEREGIIGDGPTLRLLILGDSAAAGVGADTQEAALAGQLAVALAPTFRLHWKLLAFHRGDHRATSCDRLTSESRSRRPRMTWWSPRSE